MGIRRRTLLLAAGLAMLMGAGAAAPARGSAITVPAQGARTMLPLHVMAHIGRPGEQVRVALRWQDGTTLERRGTTVRDSDGRGLLLTTVDWTTESAPPQPRTQPALLELRTGTGRVLARQQVSILSPTDPQTQKITLYWVLGEHLQAMQRSIPRTVRIGTAALEELLWGPSPGNLAGFTTALPTPAQVLSYPGRRPDWGSRVLLRGLTITRGVATANFSQELNAYGGGSTRVRLIVQQISLTLKQFPTVRTVRIAIEGRTAGVLQP